MIQWFNKEIRPEGVVKEHSFSKTGVEEEKR
jgi:hypothetical protein